LHYDEEPHADVLRWRSSRRPRRARRHDHELTHRLNPAVQLADGVTRAKKLFHDAGMDPATATQDGNHARQGPGIAAAALTVVHGCGARRR